MIMKKIVILLVLLISLSAGLYWQTPIQHWWQELNQPALPKAAVFKPAAGDSTNEEPGVQIEPSVALAPADSAAEPVKPDASQLPVAYNLDVPFTPQAPQADWNEIFKEACEEASALMVHYYYAGKIFTPETAEAEILKMVSWQKDNWGGHFDLSASRTAELITQFLGYKKIEVLDHPTIKEIKGHIFHSRPVIIPAAGRELGNPYFRSPGPVYHMLVIKGYTATQFITNDPGTKRGQDFLYDYEVLLAAMHDWDGADIEQGAKLAFILWHKK